ncbi:hypothetical protein [Pedobacter glucosidilyticus]|uniref:hypothetical protein n=1 Tax=Pedobacter glucosidilyticus TaxID=1122941 RepID=UPI0026EAF867|nr:hypothetical protein [Pedobacter glucosidilyticus]
MKKFRNIYYLLTLVLVVVLASCQKENVESANVNEISFFHPNKINADSLVTEAAVNKVLTVKVNTNADMCTLWPAGNRLTVKSTVTPTADSIDVYGNVVLVRSDDFKDYGLLFAKGFLMTGTKTTGYSFKYTYTKPGTYKMVIVATVHGNFTDGYKNNIVEKTIVVK